MAPKSISWNGFALAVLGAVLLLSCKVTDTGPPANGGGSGGATGDPGTGGGTGSGSGGDNGGGNDDAGATGSGGGSADLAPPNSDPNEIPDGGGPSSEVLAEEMMMRMRLDAITSKIMGTHTLFIDCTVSPCTTRMNAPTLTVMRQLLLAVSADFQGRINFTVRLHLDAFTGSSYQADIVLGTDNKRAVPDDENALLD